MPRPRRSAVALCIAVTALAAFLPGVWSIVPAWFEPTWVLLPGDGPVEYRTPFSVADEQPLSHLAVLASRGPPSHLPS